MNLFMKREQLKKLGLDDDQIKQVMDLNGNDLNKLKDENSSLETENKSLNDQIADRDKDLKKLKSQVKDNEDLSNQFKKLQDKYKQDTTDLNDKISQVKLDSAIDQSLTASKVRNTKAVRALLNMDNIKFDDQGKLTGLDDQVKALHKSDAYLFNEGEKQQYEPSNGKPTKVAKSLNEMNLMERIELKKSDPDTYRKMVSDAGYGKE